MDLLLKQIAKMPDGNSYYGPNAEKVFVRSRIVIAYPKVTVLTAESQLWKSRD
ncbi:MAG: hypothetical protein AABM67_08610 [Acidobacteriota bacterium]